MQCKLITTLPFQFPKRYIPKQERERCEFPLENTQAFFFLKTKEEKNYLELRVLNKNQLREQKILEYLLNR
jgi:hypothetical protein